MTDPYERIRAALAMGPTPGPFSTSRSYSPGNQELILHLTYKDEHGITENYCTVRNRLGDTWKTEADAAYIAACDPDTIRELLAERDALAAAIEAAQAERDVMREALEDIRSRMRLDPFDRLAELDNIHQIAGAALAKENSND